MGLGRPFALYVDGKFVRRVRGLDDAHSVVWRLGSSLVAGRRIVYEVKLKDVVVWEGDLETCAVPEDGP